MFVLKVKITMCHCFCSVRAKVFHKGGEHITYKTLTQLDIAPLFYDTPKKEKRIKASEMIISPNFRFHIPIPIYTIKIE